MSLWHMARIQVPSFNLPCCWWSILKRFWMGQDPCCADVHKWVLPHQSSVLVNSRCIVDTLWWYGTPVCWGFRMTLMQTRALKTTTADKSSREMKWKWLIPSVDVSTSAELLTTAAFRPFGRFQRQRQNYWSFFAAILLIHCYMLDHCDNAAMYLRSFCLHLPYWFDVH